jgi:para-aminobenzoate synthetase
VQTVLVDNYDSFTFNLYQLLAGVTGCRPLVVRNDESVSWGDLRRSGYEAVVISPGPGRPERPSDFGTSASAIADSGLPLLGVCLGHQGLCSAYGARVHHAPEPMHGRSSLIHHDGTDIFEGIPTPFSVVRYHSLIASSLPDFLQPLAWSDDGLVMAVRHVEALQWGVQFHPESIATEHGRELIENFVRLAREHRARPRVSEREQQLSVRTRRLAGGVDCAAAFRRLYGGSEHAYWLDSSAHMEGISRFSFMGDASGPLGEVLTHSVASRETTVLAHGRTTVEPGPFLELLDRRLARHAGAGAELPFEFDGGYVGYLGYEMKAECGAPAPHSSDVPDAAFVFADRFVAVDHEEDATWLVALCNGADPAAAAEAEGWLESAAAVLDGLGRVAPPSGGKPRGASSARLLEQPPFQLLHPPDDYIRLIERCQELIRDGETYEVCLTNRVTAELDVDPLRLYEHLRTVNPAPYSAFLRLPDVTVLSASPERFLKVDAAGVVEAKPIKGTAPRGRTPVEDEARRRGLAASEKDRAENLMIVDLLRNDLGIVCEIGTVRVPKLFGVESFATVHQLVSTIRGRLRPGTTAGELIRATFPGGSMTGAPKLRTMAIIDDLEAAPRGVYSGAIGYFSRCGAIDLNIVIRTLVMKEDEIEFGIGGAIIHQSDAVDELDETYLKGQALARALVKVGGVEAPPLPVELSSHPRATRRRFMKRRRAAAAATAATEADTAVAADAGSAG